MAKKKTNFELWKGIRKPMPPPAKRYSDPKKEANRKACRGKRKDEHE